MTLVKRERNQPRCFAEQQRYQEILSGVGRGGRGMLDVPLGVELNGAVPSNTHVNGFFVDYGQGLIGVDGDYETPVRKNGELGGLTMLNHIGNFTQAWDKQDPDISRKPKYVNKFARLFLDYPSCFAMDINGDDAHTPQRPYIMGRSASKPFPTAQCLLSPSAIARHDQNDRPPS